VRFASIDPVASSVGVTCPAPEVCEYLSDPLNQQEWTPNFVELVDGPHGGPGLGTRYRGRLRGFGVVDFAIDEFEPGHVFRVSTGPKLIPLTHRFAVESVGHGARIDHVVTCTPRGAARFAAPLIRLSVRYMVADLNRQLRRVINARRTESV
jgi:hypothetical protein